MTHHLTTEDLSLHLTDYLRRVEHDHDHFVVMDKGHPIAELRPVRSTPKLKDLPNVLRAARTLDSKELDDFARDIEEVRKKFNEDSLRDPWAS